MKIFFLHLVLIFRGQWDVVKFVCIVKKYNILSFELFGRKMNIEHLSSSENNHFLVSKTCQGST